MFPGKGYGLSATIILLVAIVLISWFGYNSVRSQAIIDQTLREQFQWALVPTQPDPLFPGPRTTINLKVTDVSMPLGIYAGICTIIDGKTQALLEGELSGVVCLSIDSDAKDRGAEIGIFRENEQLLLKKGNIESGATRGSNFSPIVKQQ